MAFQVTSSSYYRFMCGRKTRRNVQNYWHECSANAYRTLFGWSHLPRGQPYEFRQW